jgi:tetratricopeptide (TPR) repeat protein
MTTISCAMIVRDAEQTLRRALESIHGHVDEIVVVDTGSTDGTRAIAAEYATHVLDHEWQDDFSEARQYAHDCCSSEWVFFLDADDEVFDARALRRRIATAPDAMDAYMIRYVLANDALHNPTIQFYRERLIRKDRMLWAGRVHEVMVPISPPATYERFEQTWVLHHGHGAATESLQRNIRLLELELAEHADNSRAQFYLGRDYIQVGRLEEGVALLEGYQAHSTWADERFQALVLIGHALRVLRRFAEAYASDLRLLLVYPLWPQAWYCLAQDAYFAGLWPESVHYCEVGQGLPAAQTNLFQAPAELESGWMIFQAVALYHCGRLAEAAELTVRALQFRPGDRQHEANARFFTAQMDQALGKKVAVGSP